MATTKTKSTTAVRRRRLLLTDEIAAVRLMAETLHKGGLTPNGVNRPDHIAVRIFAGIEVGLAPIQAVNNIMVVNGRASIWGDAALALVRASGLLEHFEEGVEGEGDDRKGWCLAHRKGERAAVRKEFSVADARTAGLWEKAGPWTAYPDRMLHMRPRAWVLRDTFADVLCGLGIVEEQKDIPGASVEVVSVTTNPPPADTPPDAAAGPPATEVTIAQIGLARPAYMRARGVDADDADAVRAAWKECLAVYGVTRAKDLSEECAQLLLAHVRGAGNQQEIKEVFTPAVTG